MMFCLLVILLLPRSIFAMENPVKIDSSKPGIFLEKIVSEYERPVKISVMPLERYNGDHWVDENGAAFARISACVFKEKVLIEESQIATKIKCTASVNDKCATIREIACLRVEDVVNKHKVDIWMRKYLKFHENRDNKRGNFFVNGKVIEQFNFDHDQLSHTKITLKLAHAKILDAKYINVESVTTCLNQKYELDFSPGGPP